MCAKFPETPVVIDHLARIRADGEIRPADVRALCALRFGQAPERTREGIGRTRMPDLPN
jgi:hypothetical protein